MTQSRIRLDGQVAVVTGASSGIGRACALALGQAGAAVAVNHLPRSASQAAEAVQEIEAAGGRAVAIPGDVSVEADVEALVSRTVEAFGDLHVMVCNAGIQDDAAFLDMTLEQWSRVIGVNLTGYFLCARAAARRFVARGMQEGSPALGKIVLMSSVHDTIPWAGHANYAASKGGVMLLGKTLAQELAPRKIRVNLVSPGAIRTSINRAAWETEAALARLLPLIPYGRIGEPADIARIVVWLASDESDYVTGETIVCDGGMTLYPGFADNG
jgi:glucose 1-dehydrogenase